MSNKLVGRIFDIKKYAIHDGPGIRTTVFFQGCPLDCWWCHNPEGKSRNKNVSSVTVEEVMAEVKKDTVFYDQSGGGVTFSGGEPMMQLEFLEALLEACKKNAIHTAVDTCGYAEYSDFIRISRNVDLFLFDIKMTDDNLHKKYTGVSNEGIFSNLTKLSHDKNRIMVRIPMIPEITDTDINLRSIADFLSNLDNIMGVSLLPYNKLVESKLKKLDIADRIGRRETQSRDTMKSKASIFKEAGFDVKIRG